MNQNDYVIRGGSKGRERLRILSRVMLPTTANLFERVGLRSGMACLDMGCGGGDVTFEIARKVGSAGRVVGIDMDDTKIELARLEAADLKVPSVEFQVSDVGQFTGKAEFDFVYARFLLTHLREPVEVVRRMFSVLRSGGIAAVEDIDFSGHFCHPDCPAFWRYVELYSQVVHRRGADPNIGPRLSRLLLDCGCQNVQMNVVQPAGIEGDVKLIAPITMENIADSVIAEGLASRPEIDSIIRELYAVAADRCTVLSLPRVVQAWGARISA